MIDVESSTEVLQELRRNRRHNRLADVHWIDALYRVYIAALAAVIFVAVASGRLPTEPLSAESTARFASEGPAWLGLFFAFAVSLGLRSGGRGGPLVLEAPVVFYELLAPVDRSWSLRSPAVKQLRFAAFVGAIVGGIVGELASKRLPVNPAGCIAACAAAFALVGILAVAVAMITSGRRLAWKMANALVLVVLAWSILDIALHTSTSPLTWLADVAFWPLRFAPLGVLGIVVAVAAPVVAVTNVGGISIEAAMRRAALVSQLRFAVTLQDVRTVVLLRRQLSQERPRNQPWISLRPRGRLPAVWRRDWASLLRFPLARVARMLALGVVAGIALGFTWRGVTAAILVAALALYLAAYDAAEPIAQEVDHPTRWESFPEEPGRLLINHLPASAIAMIVVCLVATASALVLVPANVVGQLAVVVVVPIALAATVAAAVGTAQGAPDVANLAGLGPDMMGFFMLGRLVLPPAITLLAILPLLGAGSDAGAVNSPRVANAVSYALFAILGAFMWLRYRKPKHL